MKTNFVVQHNNLCYHFMTNLEIWVLKFQLNIKDSFLLPFQHFWAWPSLGSCWPWCLCTLSPHSHWHRGSLRQRETWGLYVILFSHHHVLHFSLTFNMKGYTLWLCIVSEFNFTLNFINSKLFSVLGALFRNYLSNIKPCSGQESKIWTAFLSCCNTNQC